MKIFLAILVCVSISQASFVINPKYEKYLKDFKPNENYTLETLMHRQVNFLINSAFIEKFNNHPGNLYKLGYGFNTDRDPIKFVQRKCRSQVPTQTRSLPYNLFDFVLNKFQKDPIPDIKPPMEVDWRSIMPPVLDQGDCGSCWSFSTTAILEAHQKRFDSNWNHQLSRQYFVDCSFLNDGCGGGWAWRALHWLRKYSKKEMPLASNYPYTNGDNTNKNECKKNVPGIPMNFNDIFQALPKSSEELKKIVAHYGPVVVDMYVSDAGFLQHYKSGLFSDETCEEIEKKGCGNSNHAVTLVGYGVDKKTNKPYWLVQNSWGSKWGENGYFRMLMKDNNCIFGCYAMGVI